MGGTTFCGTAAAAALAAAAVLSHPDVSKGSSSVADSTELSSRGGLGVLCIIAVVVAAAAAAVADIAADAMQLGIQRDWLWELLGSCCNSSAPWPRESEVVHSVAACEVAGFLTGGFILLYCGPVGAAASLAALQVAALAVGQLALLLLPRLLRAAASETLPTFQPANGGVSHHQLQQPQLQSHASQTADPAADIVAVQAGSSHTPYLTAHAGNCTLQGDSSQHPTPEGLSAAEPAVQPQAMSMLARLSVWSDQPACPAAAAAIMIQASLVDLGPLVLAFLVLRGVPAVLVSAAAAAAVPASALGSSAALCLVRRSGVLCSGLWAAAVVFVATWAAVAPLVTALSFEARWPALADALLVSSLALLAAGRAAFSTVVAFLMERWQEGDDTAVVGCTQRQMSAACRVVVMVVAVGLASPRRLPWLMTASAIITTVAAAVFAACAAAEMPQNHLDDTGSDYVHQDLVILNVRKCPALQLAVVSHGNSDNSETVGLIATDNH